MGVKDIFDTRDMPTEDGTVLHAGRQPEADATAVALLREAGAIILGKTVTTELAVFSPGKTRNPHDPECTPGGSSSGSAAAVAAGMVPLAIGTQTNGSVIRPASYCGVYGYKPTYGRISRHFVLQQSRPLDQIGVFARTIEDIALIAEQLMAFDDRDPDTQLRARPKLVETLARGAPGPAAPGLCQNAGLGPGRNGYKRSLCRIGRRTWAKTSSRSNFRKFSMTRSNSTALIMEADLARSFEPRI